MCWVVGCPNASWIGSLLSSILSGTVSANGVTCMAQIEHIQAEIEALSEEDFARLRKWFAERDWQRWDEQLEADVAAGKLDVLLEEAKAAKAQGNLRDL